MLSWLPNWVLFFFLLKSGSSRKASNKWSYIGAYFSIWVWCDKDTFTHDHAKHAIMQSNEGEYEIISINLWLLYKYTIASIEVKCFSMQTKKYNYLW